MSPALQILVATTLLLSLLAGDAGAAAATIPVDDSYTVSRRYDSYKEQFPAISVPELSFKSGQRVLFDRRYKSVGDRELHLDIFLPAAPKRAPRQGVILVHGGAWRSGTKAEFYPVANQLAQRGYAVFLPEYRLAPEAPYPAGLIDLNDAIVWVKAHASAYGLQPDRIAIGGGSSGGQMAALLAYASGESLFKSRADDDTRVNALIDLDGVLDFMSPLALRYENAAGDSSPAALWLGGSMEKATARWREASAAHYVGSRSPPTLIISSGELRFIAGREAVMETLEREGIRHEYLELVTVPHTFWLFDPYVGQVADRIDAFLKAVR